MMTSITYASLLLLSLAARSLSFTLPVRDPATRSSLSNVLWYSPDSSAASEDSNPLNSKRRLVEFDNLEPLLENSKRKRRQEEADRLRSQFVSFGNELWDLRHRMNDLTSKLVNTIADGQDESNTEDDLRKKLRRVEMKDAEFVYMLELADAHEAYQQGRLEDAEAHKVKAREARSCITHFNLEGLWYGDFKGHGVELINVTYVGDTLIATKVTGDPDVPEGEISFEANLHPLRMLDGPDETKESHFLEPIVLGDTAAAKWGTRQLPRYKGKGQVASSKWLDGQLVIVGEDKFGFVWTDIGAQTFFARPSDQDILTLMKQTYSPTSSSSGASFDSQVGFVERCLERTDQALEEQEENFWEDESDDEEKYFE